MKNIITLLFMLTSIKMIMKFSAGSGSSSLFIRSVTAFTPLSSSSTSILSQHLKLRAAVRSTSTSASTSASKFNKDGRSSFLFQREFPSFRQTSNLEMTSSSSSSEASTSEASPESELEQYKNKNNIDDQIFAAISGNGEIKVTAVTIRNLVNDVMIQQTLTAAPADALARSMACGLLLSNGMQAEQTFQLTLNCDGPVRNVVSISTGKGEVKGYVGNPSLGDMHISEAIGRGTVQVVKNHPDWPNPYNGITAIEHGDVDRDVGIYLAESEQRSCALAASSKINGILCVAAGGYIVEQLPFCTPETVAQVEKNLGKIIEMNNSGTETGTETGTGAGLEDTPVPAGMLNAGQTPFDIVSTILEGLDMEPLQQVTPKLVCDCTEDRLFRAVRLLPREDIDKILEEDEKLEARCHFCGKVYSMDAKEVEEKFAAATGDPSLDADN
jgi:molecular chaperone Hsp33